MKDERFLKRLGKKAKKGQRGWPVATVAFYGPNASRATKIVAAIVPSPDAETQVRHTWKTEAGDIRHDAGVAREILEFIEEQGGRSVVMTDGIIGCPHQEGIDYDGEWCPVCEYWRGRDRWTGKMIE
ncbi:MAG TPA: hypothetical protein VKG91_14590 [Roseiarcus sp.]|nr:hypothetical protein [Roseiarcus sp.]